MKTQSFLSVSLICEEKKTTENLVTFLDSSFPKNRNIWTKKPYLSEYFNPYYLQIQQDL